VGGGPVFFGRLRLRTLLALLVLTTLIPLGLFSGLLIGRLWQQQRTIVERQNVETARAISLAVDQEVASGRSALQVLAALDIFETLAPAWLNRLAVRLMATQPGWHAIVLADPSGRLVFDTAARHGDAAARFGESEWIDTVVATQRPAVSNLFQDPAAKGYFFMIAVPVMKEETLRYVLAAEVRSSTLSDILRRQRAPPGGVVSLIDRTPRIMARTSKEAEFIGKPPSERFKQASRSMREGSYEGMLLEGVRSYSSISRSTITGWTVGVGLPANAIDAPLLRIFSELALVVALLLGAGITSALVLGRALVGALTSASSTARGLARGEVVEPRHSRIVEAQDLSQGLLEAATILSMRQRERDQALAAEYAARLEAEALSRSKDEFVALMSHELRTPLNAIYGWVRLLRMGKLDPQRHEHALEVIERNTRAQTQLIEDLLDMSRIVTGKLRLEMRNVDLTNVLQSAAEGLRPAAVARDIEMVLDLQPGVGLVAGDPDRLRQIVLNLLTNSLKFTSRGGRIQVTLESEGPTTAVIRVVDNGSGIAPALLPHIFERFRQGSSAPTRKYGGLGIGLALVRHLVEMHGGTVTAASDGEDKGATFTVRLPTINPQATPAGELPNAPDDSASSREEGDTHALRGLHLLVLEDDLDAREMIVTTLKDAGAHVTAAASMHDALETLKTLTPDVVVSDIAMPNGTGYDFLRNMKSMSRTARVPAIALTAYARSEDKTQALDEGFIAHIGKPVDPSELVRAVAAAAGRL
jgi:signal transduction histidine kinase